MDEQSEQAAVLAALNTEHFVMQSAHSTTYSEASSRSTLYVMALSSALIATGFVAGSSDVLVPFAATVLPTLFLLGLFTVARLVETGLESMQYLREIARIRAHYRTLGPDAMRQFAAEHGRWPEAEAPALQLGPMLAFLGTTASMVAVINNVVAGVGIAFLLRALNSSAPGWVHAAAGVGSTIALTVLFYAYQRWRFNAFGTFRSERRSGKAAD